MGRDRVIVEAPRRIAGKFLGGFVPAVAYHYGVLDVLEERGFELRRGFRSPDEGRGAGPPGFDFVVGSSAGAFFVVTACAGASKNELLGVVEREGERFKAFEARYLGEGDGLLRKMMKWIEHGPRVPVSHRRTWRSWAAESTLNMLMPLWDLSAIERYLRDDVLAGRDWEELRTEAAILAVDLNHPATLVLGERETPVVSLFRDQPVDPEAIHRILGSPGERIVQDFVDAGVDPAHPALEPLNRNPRRRHTVVRLKGVPMACAAAGSMANYPFYAPVPLVDREGAPYRLGHYRVMVEDGEDRNPFATDVAEDAGADLVIVSLISAPYRYLHGLGSLEARGFSAVNQQKSAHGRDAKQEAVIENEVLHRRLHDAAARMLEDHNCGPDARRALRASFHRLARIDNQRIRIYPDTDIAAENRLLRRLDPLAFDRESVERAFDLGRMVAERVLAGYRFTFLD